MSKTYNTEIISVGTELLLGHVTNTDARDVSELLSKIGINVLPAYQKRGLGWTLTALLAREVERRGALPFYGTSMSHIASQRVALRAGFGPAWTELYAEPVK